MKKEGRTRQGTFANANLQLALQALTGPVYATMRDYRSDQQENSLTSWRIHGFSNRLINILRYLSNVSETSFKCFRHLSNLSCSTSLSWFIFFIQTQTKFYKKKLVPFQKELLCETLVTDHRSERPIMHITTKYKALNRHSSACTHRV